MPLVSQIAANGGIRTYVIAEMAWAHNGSLDTAIQILHGAKKAGADAIGIHLTSMPDYMVPHYRCLDGQTLSGGPGSEDGHIYRYLSQLNLKQEDWQVFFRTALDLGVQICAMCNDLASLAFAASQNAIDVYAISAASFTEHDFVLEIARQDELRTLISVDGSAQLRAKMKEIVPEYCHEQISRLASRPAAEDTKPLEKAVGQKL